MLIVLTCVSLYSNTTEEIFDHETNEIVIGRAMSVQGYAVPARSLLLGRDIMIPDIARGYEEIYLRFLAGSLIYKEGQPDEVRLPIAALANSLEGVFDLSLCKDSGQHISISTGYRKAKKYGNDILEIWIAPRFLIEQNLASSATHFNPIMGSWQFEASIGVFWTSARSTLESYDYLASTFEDISQGDLYQIRPQYRAGSPSHLYYLGLMESKHFRFSFVD